MRVGNTVGQTPIDTTCFLSTTFLYDETVLFRWRTKDFNIMALVSAKKVLYVEELSQTQDVSSSTSYIMPT